jgi:hypothetical protein
MLDDDLAALASLSNGSPAVLDLCRERSADVLAALGCVEDAGNPRLHTCERRR